MAEIYTISMPTEMIQFSNVEHCNAQWKKLLLKGMLLLMEVWEALQKLKPRFEGTLIIRGSETAFSYIEEMLQEEQRDLQLVHDSDQPIHEVFSVNKLLWELLLESCVWERRISSLLSLNPALDAEGWFWAPFAEIKGRNMKDFEKFGDIKSHSAEYLPTNIDFITRELKRVRVSFTSGEEKHIAAVFKDELTSIVACALAFLKDRPLEDNPLGVNIADDNVAVQSEACFGNFSLPLQLFSDRSSGYDSEPLIRGTIVEDCLDGLSSLRSSVTTGTRHPCIRLAFGEKEEYTVRCPYAKQFRELRSRCCSSEVDFIASLSHCTEWDAEGGKSKAFFAKTLDERLILKGIHRNEYNSFLNFANAYFDYMTNVNEENQSCLARVLGIYQVIDNVKNLSHLLIVMENLSWHRNFSEQYDLKGIDIKQRYVDVKKRHIKFEAGIVSGIFLLDKNFVERMTERPKFLSNDSREALVRALENDTTFLRTVEVMDYSLLMGVDDQRREFVCGIIDFFGPYTQCKCLESWCKSCFRVPTVLHPQQYSQRFFKFMRQHFLAMPTS